MVADGGVRVDHYVMVMDFTKIAASVKMTGTGIPVRDNSSGRLTVGDTVSVQFPDDAVIFCRRVQLCGNGSANLDLDTLVMTPTVNYAGPVAQRVALTVNGSVTTAGNVKVTVTAAVLGGALEYLVPVALADNATAVAGKVRAYLTPRLSKTHRVAGTAAVVTVERIVDDTVYGYANDGTMSVAIQNGTSVGVVTASSASAQAGAVAVGVRVPVPMNEDAEGETLPAMQPGVLAWCLTCASGGAVLRDTNDDLYADLSAGGFLCGVYPGGNYESMIIDNGVGGFTDVTLTLVMRPA